MSREDGLCQESLDITMLYGIKLKKEEKKMSTPLSSAVQTISDLLEKKKRESLTVFESARLKKALEKFSEQHPGAAYSLMGFSSALDGDFKKALALNEMALKSGESLPAAYANYGNTLALLGQHEKSASYFLKAWEMDPVDIYTLDSAIIQLLFAGNTEMYSFYTEEYKKITGEEHRSLSAPPVVDLYSDVTSQDCFNAAMLGGAFDDWASPEEDEAWKHLQ